MIWLGILIGIAISALWNFVLRFAYKVRPELAIENPERLAPMFGPFIHKKKKGVRKPISHTDEEIWALENKDKLL